MGEQIKTSSSSSSMNCNENNSITCPKFPLALWEIGVASGVVLGFGIALFSVYLTMPVSDYTFLKLPRTLHVHDLCILRDDPEIDSNDYTTQVLANYCMVYIVMQTFMIPGTLFLSLLAGSLFAVLGGVALIVFNATAGASSCCFL